MPRPTIPAPCGRLSERLRNHVLIADKWQCRLLSNVHCTHPQVHCHISGQQRKEPPSEVGQPESKQNRDLRKVIHVSASKRPYPPLLPAAVASLVLMR